MMEKPVPEPIGRECNVQGPPKAVKEISMMQGRSGKRGRRSVEHGGNESNLVVEVTHGVSCGVMCTTVRATGALRVPLGAF